LDKKNLILTASGIRGIAHESLTIDFVKKLAWAFGTWLKNEEKTVVIGRDTRISGKPFEDAIIEGLTIARCKIINLGICPTPIIIFSKNQLNIAAGMIISGSHNPPEWNGIKLLHGFTFIDENELNQIMNLMENHSLNANSLDLKKKDKWVVEHYNPIPEYVRWLYLHVDVNEIKQKNHLKVAIDTGAGAGKLITPQLLTDLGCEVIKINNEFVNGTEFPRNQEPIAKNLQELIVKVMTEKCDVGFAHDCDADRLAIIGEDGTWYPEDTGLAIIANHYLKNSQEPTRKIFVTNLASSMMFDVIAEKYDAELIRTPVGERHLAAKMQELLDKYKNEPHPILIFGGEGSCGGIMFPPFNNARDGIFATAKLIEILTKTGKSMTELVSELPKFYSYRQVLEINSTKIHQLIHELKSELVKEGEDVSQHGLDLRFGKDKEWFVLIHPSNTEPVIRVIAEAKRESLARLYCETTTELLKIINSRLN